MELTGGTGDVNPQWFNIVSQVAITTSFATTTVPTPINKFPEQSGKVVIMEILKIFFYFPVTLSAIATTFLRGYRIYLGTRNFATTEPSVSDGSVLTSVRRNFFPSGTPANELVTDDPMTIDLTDGAGHGMLVATDNLYLGIIAATETEPYDGVVNCKVLYRFKKVALQEYIGIVQAQQSTT